MWERYRNELRFTLFVFLLLLLVCFAYPQSTSSDQVTISRSELDSLSGNLLKLSLLSQSLNAQIVILQGNSKSLLTQLDGLEEQKRILDGQLASLESELQSLRTQYEGSLMDLMRLTEQLGKLEHSYKTLLASFELYKKEVNRQITTLKAEKAILGGLSAAGGALALFFAVLWLIEKFGG